MDALLGDGSTHTPGQPPSATSVCIHQAGLRAYGVYLADTRIVPFPRYKTIAVGVTTNYLVPTNKSHQSPLRGQRWIHHEWSTSFPIILIQKNFFWERGT